MTDGADDPGPGVSARLAALHGRPLLGRKRRLSLKVWIISTAVVVAGLVAAFALASAHYNDTVLNSTVCPAPARVNALIGTTLDNVAGLQLSDLHSCHYSEGPDTKALWIDGAVPKADSPLGRDPCRHRPPITVAGYEACSVSGTPGTTPGRPSLFVESTRVDWQFTTNLISVSMTRLATLAKALLDTARPLVASRLDGGGSELS